MAEDLEIIGNDGQPLTESEAVMLLEEFEAWQSKVGASVAAKTPDVQSYYDQVWIPSLNAKRMYPMLTKPTASNALPEAPGVAPIQVQRQLPSAPGVVPMVNTQKPMPALLPLSALRTLPGPETGVDERYDPVKVADSIFPNEVFALLLDYFGASSWFTAEIQLISYPGLRTFIDSRIIPGAQKRIKYPRSRSVAVELVELEPEKPGKRVELVVQVTIGSGVVRFGVKPGRSEAVRKALANSDIVGTEKKGWLNDADTKKLQDLSKNGSIWLNGGVPRSDFRLFVYRHENGVSDDNSDSRAASIRSSSAHAQKGLVPSGGLKDLPSLVPLKSALPGLVPLDSDLPGLVPLKSALPGLVPLDSDLPGLVPLKSALPGLVPLGSNLPGLVPLKAPLPELVPLGSNLPGLVPLKAPLPELVPLGSNLPSLVPLKSDIPGLVPLRSALPGLVPLAAELPGLVPLTPDDGLKRRVRRGDSGDSGVFADLVTVAQRRPGIGLKTGQIASAINANHRPALFKAAQPGGGGATAVAQPPVKRTLASDPKTSVALQYSVSVLAHLFLEPSYRARASANVKGFVSDLHGASLSVAANDAASVRCYAPKFKHHVLDNKHPETKMLFATHASVVASAVREHDGSDEIYAAIGKHLSLPVAVEQRVPWLRVSSLDRSWARYMDMVGRKLAPDGTASSLDPEEEFEIIAHHFTRAANGIVNDQVVKTDQGKKTGGVGKDDVHELVAKVAYAMFTTVTNTWFSSPSEKDRRQLLSTIVRQISGYVESIRGRFGLAAPKDYTSATNMAKMQDNVRHYISKEINDARAQGVGAVPRTAARNVSEAIKRSWAFSTYAKAKAPERLTQDYVTAASAVLLMLIASQGAMNMRRPNFDLTSELELMGRRLVNGDGTA